MKDKNKNNDGGNGGSVKGRYKFNDGKWSPWAIFDSYKDATDVLSYHGKGKYQIVSIKDKDDTTTDKSKRN